MDKPNKFTLFISPSGQVENEVLSYGVVYDRLKLYLRTLELDEGETPHSLRDGCAITARSADQGMDGGADATCEMGNRRNG